MRTYSECPSLTQFLLRQERGELWEGFLEEITFELNSKRQVKSLNLFAATFVYSQMIFPCCWLHAVFDLTRELSVPERKFSKAGVHFSLSLWFSRMNNNSKFLYIK